MVNGQLSIFNFLFPSFCVVCKKMGELLCAECQPKIRVIENSFCVLCGIPFVATCKNHPCSHCLREKPEYDQHRSVFVFSDPLKKLIHSYKYRGQFWLKRFFSESLKKVQADFKDIDVIVPVPLHPKRLRKRGFNQSQGLAYLWSQILDKRVLEAGLTRIKNNPTQTGLNKKQRRDNLKNAFVVKEASNLKDKKILLVDDVHTTGVTLNEAAKTLKKSGSGPILASSLAIVA